MLKVRKLQCFQDVFHPGTQTQWIPIKIPSSSVDINKYISGLHLVQAIHHGHPHVASRGASGSHLALALGAHFLLLQTPSISIDGPSNRDPAVHVGNTKWISRSWLLPSPAPAALGVWGMNQHTGALFPLRYINTNNFNNNTMLCFTDVYSLWEMTITSREMRSETSQSSEWGKPFKG